jgi:taurine dioxygenase
VRNVTIEVKPITSYIGAEISGADLSKPLSDSDFADIHQAWLDHTILLFRGQEKMGPAEHIAFSRRFGPSDAHSIPKWTLPGFPEIAVVSNVVENGRNIGAPKSGRTWHSDGQYLPVPAKGSVLVAREVPPEKGDTLFANMYQVYGELDPAQRARAEGKYVLHSRVKAWPISYPERPPLTAEEIAKLPDVVHPLVRTHPETRRQALYSGGNIGWEIVGEPFEESHQFLKELRAFATQPRFVYAHKWKAGDVILWDNRCAMHCATTFDEENHRRVMHRTHIAGDLPFYERAA